MLLVLISLPALPTPTTCAQAVATLNADEALAKEFAAYNKTDCMSYDFDPKNQLDTWCQQFSMFLVVACSVGYHPPTTVETFA